MNRLNFRIALLKKGISQNEFARRIKIHPQSLSSMLLGHSKMTDYVKERINAIKRHSKKSTI